MTTATGPYDPHMTFQAILFDCDGVLVDSEAITCGVPVSYTHLTLPTICSV